MKFSEHLWNKYDLLNDRYKHQYDYGRNFLELLYRMQVACSDYSKSLKNILSKNYKIVENEESSVGKSIEGIRFNYSIQEEEFNEISDYLKTKIYDPTKILLDQSYYQEKDKYIELKKSVSKYIDSCISTDRSKQKFHTSAQAAENLMITAMQMKAKALSTISPEMDSTYKKAKNLLLEAQGYEKVYISNIEKSNALRIESIEKQREFLEVMQTIESNLLKNMKTNISLFIVTVKKMASSILIDLETLSDKFKNINIDADIDAFINENKCDDAPDKEIVFEPYKPITPTVGQSDKLTLNYEVLKEIKTTLKDVLPEYNLQEEAVKCEIRDLCIRVFKSNKEFQKEDMDKLLSFVQEKESRRTFLYTLNKQRTSGQFNRSERIMNYLTELVNKILLVSEKDQDFESAKNCIILSQTFYIDSKKDKNAEKHYLFEKIQNNKWLKSINFWYGIIDKMIKGEMDRNIPNIDGLIEKEEDKKRRIGNIAFSQVLPYTNNMLDFKIEKKLILKLIDQYVKDYGIEQGQADAIITNVNERKY